MGATRATLDPRARSSASNEERAAVAAREVLVDRFAEWLDAHPVAGADPWDTEFALSWKHAYADGHYGRWTRDDVDEHLPRKLSASPQQAATIPGSIAAFVRFFDGEGLLDRGGDPADAIARRAAAQQRAFEDAMGDPANFGMAKRLLSHGGFDVGDDPPDRAALDEARERFNALPFEERGRILGFNDEPDDEPLPALPIRPAPPLAELEALAADVVLLQRLDRLHAELATDGTRLTKAGRLPLAEARRLVAALGLDDRTEGIRSSAELPELWSLALVGFDVLLPEQIEGIGAGEVIDLLVERDLPAEMVAAHWAAGRPRREAADEVLAALTARPEPARLVLGFAVLEHFGDGAVEAARAVLDGPLAPHAWTFLSAVGAVDPDDVPVELAVQAASPRSAARPTIETLLGGIPPGDHVAFVDSMASADHPGTATFLDLLGRHHPDKAVAKRARKQAHRWRSAHPGH